MNKVLSYCLIVAGSFLEVFYIIARYKPDGIFTPICIVIGIALNVFLMIATYNKNKALMIALIVFSVLNTSAGQTLSLKKSEVKTVSIVGIDETEKQNKRYEKDIETLDSEIDAINKRLNGFETMEEKAKYKNNVLADEQSVKDKRKEKERIEKLISDNTKEKKTAVEKSVQAESVYSFYGSMNKWTSSDWLTFVLHTVFSFFMSIMAPYGIHTLTKQRIAIDTVANPLEKEKPAKQYQRLKTLTLENWIELMWFGEKRDPKELRIPPTEIVKTWCEKKGYRFDDAEHAERIEQAKRLKLLSDNGRLLVSQASALDAMTGQQSLF